MNNTHTDIEIIINQPGYLFMIVFFGFWCIISGFMQIDKCHEKKNNIIVESNSDSDSECSDSDSDYNYTPSYHVNQQRRQNRNITSVGIEHSESECSDYEEEEEYDKIKTKKIKTFSNVNKYPKFCSICQENVLNSVQIDCGHCYCKECIEQHIQKNFNCPLCRQDIKNIYEIEVLIFK